MSIFVITKQEDFEAPDYIYVEADSIEVVRGHIYKAVKEALDKLVDSNRGAYNSVRLFGRHFWLEGLAGEIAVRYPYMNEVRANFTFNDITFPIQTLEEYVAGRKVVLTTIIPVEGKEYRETA